MVRHMALLQCYGMNYHRLIMDHRAAPELHVIVLHRGGSLAQRRPTLQCYGLHCHGMRME